MIESTILEQNNSIDLQMMQTQLVVQMNKAYDAHSFHTRNEIASKAVSQISSTLAFASLGLPTEFEDDVKSVFTHACRRSGGAFAVSFNEDGTPRADKEGAYKAAQKAAADVAANYNLYSPQILNGVAQIASKKDKRIEVISLVKKADFTDTIALVAHQLHRKIPTQSNEVVVAFLHGSIDVKDYFYNQIDNLIFHDGSVSPDTLFVLDAATRLANATWLTGQVHRAVWEGKRDRINPDTREAFNPYDYLKEVQFDRYCADGDADQGVYRVAFEVWKDITMLQQFLPSK